MAKYTGVYRTSPAKNSTWYFKLYLGRFGGKRKFVTRGGFASAKEAHDARTAEATRVMTGTFSDPGRQTVGEYIERWAAGLRLAESSMDSYRYIVRSYITPYLGAIRLRDLTPAHVSEIYRQIEAERAVGSTTLHNIHRVLHAALQAAVTEGLLARNPSARIANPPRVKRRRMTTWTLEQAQHFAACAGDHYAYGAWMVMLAASTRKGEAIGIRWPDVDLEAGRISLQGARVGLMSGGVYLSSGKTAGSCRTLHLDDDLVAILRKQRAQQAAWRLSAGPEWVNEDWVFTYPKAICGHRAGDPLDPKYVADAFKREAARLGLPEIRLYDLRHTSASIALLQGVHPKVVQERLGHSSIAQTLDTYSHVAPGLHRAAAHRLGAAIFGRSTDGV